MIRTAVLGRRGFLGGGAAALASAACGPAVAAPFFARHKLPIGIQLYTLAPDAAQDLDATLAAIAKVGYRTVELHGMLGRTAAQLKAALDRVGLSCPSIHVPARASGADNSFTGDLGKLGEALNTIGARHAVMPSPLIPERLAKEDWQRALAQLTADDWKAVADLLNRSAAKLRASGIAVGYHNHNLEFAPLGSTNGLEILLKETDPKLVSFEGDVGWMAAAGIDPLTFIQKHKGRFSLMHVKDVKASTKANFALKMDPTEVGSGRLDWKRLLPGAHAAGVREFFVEQEPPFERPRIEAAKISHDFLARLEA